MTTQRILGLFLGLFAVASPAQSQDSTRTFGVPEAMSCPASAGASLVVSSDGRVSAPRVSLRDGIDTVYRFSIDERRWSQPSLDASLGAGVADSARGWWLCAAATVNMQQPTLFIRRADGTVRLRVDLTDLRRALRGAATTP
jgi:hypothetical protein